MKPYQSGGTNKGGRRTKGSGSFNGGRVKTGPIAKGGGRSSQGIGGAGARSSAFGRGMGSSHIGGTSLGGKGNWSGHTLSFKARGNQTEVRRLIKAAGGEGRVRNTSASGITRIKRKSGIPNRLAHGQINSRQMKGPGNIRIL